MNDLVTIKTSNIPGEMAVAKSYLEDNEIFCFLKDELINQVHPLASIGVGGIKLQVREEDAQRAAELLIEGGFAKKKDFEIPESTMRLVRIYEKISSFLNKKR
ncbi:MAG: putative signal transducing protein [Dysgonomonas sp.]